MKDFQARIPYCGRFAPSPSGALHFGSLVAALGSFLDARALAGKWLVRIEDIDTPRTVPGAAEDILRTLEGFGLEWDGEVLYQSRRLEAYHATMASLKRHSQIYACNCSRREISAASGGGQIYSGRCRDGLRGERVACAWRLKVPAREIAFVDRVQGRFSQNLQSEVGDFVLFRADGLFAYQLAVVVDDAEQGVTHVVRGADMLDSTPRQIYLQEILGHAHPSYLHLPLATHPNGQKLSKQNLAPPLNLHDPKPELLAALAFLGHPAPAEVCSQSVPVVIEWAVSVWDPLRVPARSLS